MNVSHSIQQEFFAWADLVLAQPLPSQAVAFHFNLYEGTDSVHVQIAGNASFDPADYWPAEETFSTGENIFEVPFGVAGANWEEWLESLMELVSAYVSSGTNAAVLRRSLGVGIGFVDGDMYVLWQADAA